MKIHSENELSCFLKIYYNCFKLIADAGIKSIYFDEFYRDERIIKRSEEAGIQLIDINN